MPIVGKYSPLLIFQSCGKSKNSLRLGLFLIKQIFNKEIS
ncbi:hypothetical protein cbdbA1561 [Dehalococcoides mccartyi CBDB1]|uniref:Uncharacterized protein n=1 Tax=Dehalococcoides mccartyi (strain CBDB1) TaxID=255470 RepID=A0A916KNJ3_DEHMC|nr:hypothetical protein cbdbA1561 [Dehalococcoides mccartyi CBDB1]